MTGSFIASLLSVVGGRVAAASKSLLRLDLSRLARAFT
jgi:hypothetical protein